MHKAAYLDSAEKDLCKLDKPTVKKILARIENYLAQDPRGLGKQFKGEFKGYWRYRWGDCRVIYRISEREILIIVLRIGHRKEIYS